MREISPGGPPMSPPPAFSLFESFARVVHRFVPKPGQPLLRSAALGGRVSHTAKTQASLILVRPSRGDAPPMKTTADTKLKFFDGTATILMSRHETGVSVVDLELPAGTSSIVHAHDEDESIRVLEGRVLFDVDGEMLVAEPGQTVVLPKGVPHSYEVASVRDARWLSISSPGRFEDFVRAAATLEDDPIALTVAAADSGIELLGRPPLPLAELAYAA